MSAEDPTPTISETRAMEASDTLEDYLAAVYDDLREGKRIRDWHDQDGGIYALAGSQRCLDAGHTDAHGEWDTETHTTGWDGDILCLTNKSDTACTVCESSICEGRDWVDVPTRNQFWNLFATTERPNSNA